MLVSTVTGVHHVGVEEAREEVRRTSGLVADDNDVRIQRLEIARSVAQASHAKEDASAEKLMISALRRLAESSKLTRASGGFDKKFDRLALWGEDLLNVALAYGLKLARGVEHGGQFLGCEAFDIQQMLRCQLMGFGLRPSQARRDRRSALPRVHPGGWVNSCQRNPAGWAARDGRDQSAARRMHLGRPNPSRASMEARTVRPVYGVINQHNRLAGQIAGQLGGAQLAHAALGKIIAMQTGLHRPVATG